MTTTEHGYTTDELLCHVLAHHSWELTECALNGHSEPWDEARHIAAHVTPHSGDEHEHYRTESGAWSLAVRPPETSR